MTRKRTVRRVYALVDTISHAAYQCSKLTVSEWNAQMVPVLSAVESLRSGDWNPQANWQPMFEALNRIESMLKLGHASDHGMIARAQETYITCLSRMEQTGATAFKADELATIREVAEVYGDLLREISHADFARACNHTNANVGRVIRDRRGITVAGCRVERIAA